jgi:hypothetical protein
MRSDHIPYRNRARDCDPIENNYSGIRMEIDEANKFQLPEQAANIIKYNTHNKV